jgi:hypothetical protein
MNAEKIETIEHRGITFLVGQVTKVIQGQTKRWWIGEPVPEMEQLVEEINYTIGSPQRMWRDSASWPVPESEGSKTSVINDMKRDIDAILDGGFLKPLAEKMSEALELSNKFWSMVKNDY